MVGPTFVDTSVLLPGLIDLGVQSRPAQSLLEAVVMRRVRRPTTAWHCCLEFYSVSTRLPAEVRLTPEDALRLLEDEVWARFDIRQLPGTSSWQQMFRLAVRERVAGGRLYDAHIAQVARSSGAKLIVTENPRHFSSLLRDGIRVMRSEEALSEIEETR